MSAKSYKQHPITGAFDAIVIGSGMGGLSTAALLSKEGKRVLVLEKHYVAGGFTHTFKRKGYEWDVGLHYVGEVNRKTSVLSRVFDDVTDAQLQWADMGEVYDRIFIGDDEYPFVKGIVPWMNALKARFPGEEQAIERYVERIREVQKSARGYFAEKALPGPLAFVARPFMSGAFLKLAAQTTGEVLRELTKNERLVAVLAGQYGDYGLPPAQSSFAMHAILVGHYFGGGAYPIGGSQRIAETMIPVIMKAGGEVFINAGVDHILIEDGRAVGVKLEDGKEVRAPVIVSSAGIGLTYEKLITRDVAEKHGLFAQAKSLTPSVSHVCLYVGIKEAHLDAGKANLWIYPHEDHDRAVREFLEDPTKPLPVVYVSFPSAKDPDWERRYPGTSTIEVITLAPYDWFAAWDGTAWKKRGAEYEALKAKLTERLLETLYRHVPQVKGKIDHHELSSPLSTKNFTSWQRGEIYGMDHTPERFAKKYLRPRTPIDGLFLTGQDIVTAGIGGALFGGVLTASAILRKNVLNDVLERVPAKRE